MRLQSWGETIHETEVDHQEPSEDRPKLLSLSMQLATGLSARNSPSMMSFHLSGRTLLLSRTWTQFCPEWLIQNHAGLLGLNCEFSSKCIESTPAYFGHPINLLWSLHHNLINLISDTTFDFYIFLLPTGSIGSFSIWVFIRTESLSELIEALIRCENDGLECWHQPKHVTLDLLSHIMLESSSC